jgi:hypothetical protein
LGRGGITPRILSLRFGLNSVTNCPGFEGETSNVDFCPLVATDLQSYQMKKHAKETNASSGKEVSIQERFKFLLSLHAYSMG